jgi:tRNA-specific 2-thiouridylase
MIPETIAVALSGGVDSATAAALLVEQGHEVIGLTMRLWQEPAETESTDMPLCDPTENARQVAQALDIPFHVVDAAYPFKQYVVASS